MNQCLSIEEKRKELISVLILVLLLIIGIATLICSGCFPDSYTLYTPLTILSIIFGLIIFALTLERNRINTKVNIPKKNLTISDQIGLLTSHKHSLSDSPELIIASSKYAIRYARKNCYPQLKYKNYKP